ncbi:Zn-dependent hydrolase [Virgisporangium aliadipatigenens]|uniref:Zn-dependent hydrolase n=1 Tax=Virgisporangium aliadipatigenens TaxID=741659 RepID=A0A8J3YWY7_9ACTN|nr:allantoate amidohydrolase [Virgisporangium aliadipatigenens]GIJ52128.1 Zn-dependent hydrolase [Virgisporangium aliadipatigenens]
MTPERFGALWRSLAHVGRDATSGGYLRYSFGDADLRCREWFTEEALDRDLSVETDRNGNVWAWWGDQRGSDAVVTGSHLDSVPHGGAYDGPLGVVSALLAIDVLRERGLSAPHRPIAVVVFAEEEGARFGVPCLGSRLMTGAIAPEQVRTLRDRDRMTYADGLLAADLDPDRFGPDTERLGRIGVFVELHVEQGKALVELDAPIGVADAIWPHGRWRITIDGAGDHAGTTRMSDRRDPMLTFAYGVLAANKEARLAGAHATVGRVAVEPGATNAIPSRVTAWLDARAADPSTLDAVVAAVSGRLTERAGRDGTTVEIVAESVSPSVSFDPELRDRIVKTLGGPPVLPTGAGHDAGVLSAHVPTAMLFVRNPTGVSHAPGEHATDVDCAAGVNALADVLAELAWR